MDTARTTPSRAIKLHLLLSKPLRWSTTARHCDFFAFQHPPWPLSKGVSAHRRCTPLPTPSHCVASTEHHFQGCAAVASHALLPRVRSALKEVRSHPNTRTTELLTMALEGPTGGLFPRVKAPAKRSLLEPARLSKANHTVPWIPLPNNHNFFSITNYEEDQSANSTSRKPIEQGCVDFYLASL